jgi:hypothetical protein
LLLAATPPAGVALWLGFWPGEAFADVVAKNGPPIFSHHAPDGSVTTFNHSAKNADAYVVIVSQSGVLQEIGVVANRAEGSKEGLTDPSGVSLGDTVDKLKARRGEPSTPAAAGGTTEYMYKGAQGIWVYDVEKGVVADIRLLSPNPRPAHPATGKDGPHDGSSPEKAFVITARSEDEGVHFEYYYARTLAPCAGQWNFGGQALVTANHKSYDRLSMTCPLDKSQRAVFFEVSSFLGKY